MGPSISHRLFASSLAILVSLAGTFAAETETAPAGAAAASAASPEMTAALASLGEQRRIAEALLQQIEAQTRTTRRETELLGARLEGLRAALDLQRNADRAALHEAGVQLSRTIRLASLSAGAVLLAGLVVGAFLLRALRRVAEVPAQLSARPGAGLPFRSGVLAPDAAVQHVLLNGTVSELERRVRELESSIARSGPADAGAGRPVAGSPANTGELGALLGQGRAALKAGQAREAVDCFDAVLRFDPCHVEALVKLGRALEMLGRGSEALESYERALAVDTGLAAAFLGKQGVVDLFEKSGGKTAFEAHAMISDVPPAIPRFQR